MSTKDELIKLADEYSEVMNLHGIENVDTFVGLTIEEGEKLKKFLNSCDELLNMAMDMEIRIRELESKESEG